jgi:hypothetical protein
MLSRVTWDMLLWVMLVKACYLSHITWATLLEACYLRHVTWVMLIACYLSHLLETCYLIHVTWAMSVDACYLSHITWVMLIEACYLSHLLETCYLSHVTWIMLLESCYLSNVTWVVLLESCYLSSVESCYLSHGVSLIDCPLYFLQTHPTHCIDWLWIPMRTCQRCWVAQRLQTAVALLDIILCGRYICLFLPSLGETQSVTGLPSMYVLCAKRGDCKWPNSAKPYSYKIGQRK